MRAALCGVLVAGAAVLAQSPPPQSVPPQPAAAAPQRPPVFRTGAHYVAVDAYPTKGGRILEGLTRDDLEIFEDGKPQAIDRFEFVRADTRPPDDERPAYLSPRAGLELAGDPRYRVILIVLDRNSFVPEAWIAARESLREFLHKEIQPRDLLGVITTDETWEDLVLGRRLSAIEEAIDDPDWLLRRPQDTTRALSECGYETLRGRIRADAAYGMLEGLLRLFGQVREDRTSLLFVSSGLSRQPPDRRGLPQKVGLPPKMGLVNGRIQVLRGATDMNESFCRSEGQRLVDTDFDRRFDELTRIARASNVAFYTVPVLIPDLVAGVMPVSGRGSGRRGFSRPGDSLTPLASDTDGVAVPTAGDVRRGLRHILEDTGSHYLLGYYTTNTKWDGKLRSIKVRLKSSGAEIRARRQYRAPTREEIDTFSSPESRVVRVVPEAVVNALEPLTRLRPSAQFHGYGAVSPKAVTVTIEVPPAAVAAGRWSDGAALDLIAETADGTAVGMGRGRLPSNGRTVIAVPLDGTGAPSNVMVRVRAEGETVTQKIELVRNPSALVGDPLAYRSGPRGLNLPVASFVFARDERVRLDWPTYARLDAYEARLIDRFGLPLRLRVALQSQQVGTAYQLTTEIAFAPLARGDYVIELTASAGPVTETRLLALRVR